MYLNFYKMRKKPFSLAPDPEFLYLSQQHRDALGAMIYGVREREGFISVIGEVGTGKTTVVKSYLQKASRNHILPVFIFNSRISFAELLTTFLSELGVDKALIQKNRSLNELVRLAYLVMLEKSKNKLTIVLIIDEAQNMPVETLGKLCILSNFETTKAKLIQIVLVGQPELQKKLALHELRQLRQRIAYRALITPLSAKESVKYINHRLSVSSKEASAVFTKNAIDKIVNYSKGVPRVINVLCENALVAGYGSQKKPVSKKLVNQVIAEYEGRPLPRALFKKVCGSLLVLLLAMLTLSIYSRTPHPTENLNGKFLATVSPGVKSSLKNVTAEKSSDISSDVAVTLPPSAGSPPAPGDDSKICRDDGTEQPGHSFVLATSPVTYDSTRLKTPHLRVARQGDTVSALSILSYGFVNSQVLRWVHVHNPHILDIDKIQIGEMIFFPELKGSEFLGSYHRQSSISGVAKEEVVSR